MSLAEQLAAGPPSKRIEKPSNILTVDIERLPGTARFWDLYRTPPRPSDVITSPRIICLAWTWYGRPAVRFASEWGQGTEGMLRRAWEAYDRADIVVTYNGISFDDKHLRTEWAEAGMPPPSPWKAVDLFREVKRSFGFETKSLDAVCKRLGLEGKVDHYDADVAEAAVNGDREAQRTLRLYNQGDVLTTEALYDRLRGWLPGHPHIARTDAPDGLVCNQCGCEDLERQHADYRANVLDYALYRCRNCGANVRAGYTRRAANSRGVR